MKQRFRKDYGFLWFMWHHGLAINFDKNNSESLKFDSMLWQKFRNPRIWKDPYVYLLPY